MSKFVFFALHLFIIFSTPHESLAQTNVKKHLVYLGGGGEAPGSKTIFDTSTRKLGAFFDDNVDWTYQLSFNGGHSNTEEIIQKKFSKQKNKPFTAASFAENIQSSMYKVKNELKAGDQLLVIVDTHGGTRKTDQTTHTVCGVGDKWTECSSLSLDPLGELAKVAKEKGVKLAVLDMSCHSGATLALANQFPETCIISSTAEHTYAVSGFSAKMADNFKKGNNLEDAYLKARKNHTEADMPQISTAAGLAIKDQLMDPLSERLLLDDRSINAKLLSQTLATRFAEKKLVNTCNQDSISKMMNWAQSTLSQTQNKVFSSQYDDLKVAIRNYDEVRNKIEDELKKQNDLDDYVEPMTCVARFKSENTKTEVTQTFNIQYTVYELLNSNFERQFENVKARPDGVVNSPELAQKNCHLELIKKAQERTEQLKKDPRYLANLKIQSDLEGLYNKTAKLANKVGTKERQLYDDLYKAMNDRAQSNPCRDFIL